MSNLILANSQLEPGNQGYLYSVRQINQLSADIFQIFLLPATSARIPYQAGQYLEMLSADQSRKPFSIANAPAPDGAIELHIRHNAGNPYTQSVMDELNRGTVTVFGAYGHCIFQTEPDYPSIFVAGGTGFAPLKALIEHALTLAVARPLYLYWGVRQAEDFYLTIPETWQRQEPQFLYRPVLGGYVHNAVLAEHPDLSKFHVYAAGPTAMVAAALHDFQAQGLMPAMMYSDAFDRF